MTTYRQSCGTHLGMRLHQEHLEEPCGECLIGEAGRRLYAEYVPHRPTRPHAEAPLATDAEVQERRRVLAQDMGAGLEVA